MAEQRSEKTWRILSEETLSQRLPPHRYRAQEHQRNREAFADQKLTQLREEIAKSNQASADLEGREEAEYLDRLKQRALNATGAFM